MKQNPKHLVLLLLLTVLCRAGIAQIVTTSPEDWNTLIPGGVCNNCSITIPAGYILNLSTGTCNGCTFNNSGELDVTGAFNFVGTSTSTTIFGGSVNMNASGTYSGTTNIIATTMTVNAPTTFSNVNLQYDSIQANKNITASTGTNQIQGSSIEVASGVALNFASPQISQGSLIAFAGNSSMTTSGSLNIDASNLYLNGTSSVTSSGTTAVSGGSFIGVIGTAANFSANNLTSVNQSYIELDSASTMSSNSLPMIGGGFTQTGSSVYTSAGTVNFGLALPTTVSMSGTSQLKGTQLTVSKGTFTMSNNATIGSMNPISITGATVTMNGHASLGGTSATLSNVALIMNDTTSITTTGNLSITGPNATTGSTLHLNSNSAITVNGTMTVMNSSKVYVGGGSGVATAHIFSSGALNIVDNNSLVSLANDNNYYKSSSAVAGNTFNCGAGYANACSANMEYGCATITNTGTTSCTVLALNDLDLTATVAGPTSVNLNFTDDEATLAAEYLVQRKLANGNGQWATISTIPAGSFTVGVYHYLDADAPNGTIDYRIARVNQTNAIQYSTISSVTLGSSVGQISIRPNPVTGGTIYITTPYTSDMIVNIFTITGQLLLRSTVNGQKDYAVRLPSEALATNAIVVQTIGQGGTQSFTLLIR